MNENMIGLAYHSSTVLWVHDIP